MLITATATEEYLQENYNTDAEIPTLYHAKSQAQHNKDSLLPDNSANIYVYAKQGKSKYTGLWCLKDLLDSNANLVEMGPEIPSKIDAPVIPPGGIEVGLCKSIVFLKI